MINKDKIEDPLDYMEYKKQVEILIQELKELTTPQPLIVCIGNKTFFNLK